MASNMILKSLKNTKICNAWLKSALKSHPTLQSCRYISASQHVLQKEVQVKEEEENGRDKRDISGLPRHLRNQMKHVHIAPTAEELDWHPSWNKTSFQRSLYAEFGRSSGINPGVSWPTKEELVDIKSDEAEFEPTLQVQMENVAAKKQEELELMQAKEDFVEKQMAKMPKYIAEMKNKELKRKAEEKAAQAKRKVLLEDAREYFGFDMDPKDPRFKQMEEIKAEEERLAKKKAKKEQRKAQQAIKIQYLAKGKGASKSDSQSSDS